MRYNSTRIPGEGTVRTVFLDSIVHSQSTADDFPTSLLAAYFDFPESILVENSRRFHVLDIIKTLMVDDQEELYFKMVAT